MFNQITMYTIYRTWNPPVSTAFVLFLFWYVYPLRELTSITLYTHHILIPSLTVVHGAGRDNTRDGVDPEVGGLGYKLVVVVEAVGNESIIALPIVLGLHQISDDHTQVLVLSEGEFNSLSLIQPIMG